MLNLDLTLRSAGRILLLERGHAQALLDRSLEERRGAGGTGLISRLMSSVASFGRAKAGDDDDNDAVDRSKLALPSISWAGTIEYGDGYAIVEGVAVIDVSGVLTPDGYYDWWNDCWYGGYSQIGSAVEAARGDDRVKAILMRVYSPGGLVDGCFDLADAIRSGNAAAGGKPVWVHTRLACSAAYALASAADRIVASAEGDVGSIGVLVMHVDVSDFYAEHGIKIEAIQSGARKTDGAEWKPLSDDARKHLQGVVDQVAKRFMAVVSAGRGLSTEAISAMQAQWYLADHDDPTQSGLKLGLVDQIAAERTAFADLVSSLSGETESGAPAETGEGAASSAARAGTAKETEMSLKDQITALRAKAAAGDKTALDELKAMGVPLAEADPADDDEEKEAAEPEKDEADEEDDADAEPEAKATGTKAAFKLLSSKAAKGRDQLAQKLAAKVASGKFSYGEAKGMLEAAPKGSRLADAMDGRDHNPGNDAPGAGKSGEGLAAAVDRLNARRKAS